MKKNRVTVAEYLTQQIALSGIPQFEIAERLGYDKPNIITMFKQGKTKLPLNKVAPMAKILGIDPVHFLRLVMLEYTPETWEVLESLLGQRLIAETEQRILELVRSSTAGRDVVMSEARELQLVEMFGEWAKHDAALATAAVEASTKTRSKPGTAHEAGAVAQ